MGPKPASSCGWWRSHFEDHLYFVLKKPEAAQSGKCKVICIHCLDMRIGEVMLADEQDVVNRQRSEVHSQKTIKLMLFSADGNGTVHHEWLVSRSDPLLRHLQDCPHQPTDIQDCARNELHSRSPVKRAHSVNNLSQLAQPILYYPTTSFLHPDYPNATIPSPFDAGPSESRPPSSSSSMFASISRAPSIAPSDSVSAVGTRRSYSSIDDDSSRNFALKRARYSLSHQPSVTYQPAPISWTPSDQARFEECIVRLTASAGFALSWVENPEWVAFCDDFLPAAKVLSRKVVTNRLLPTTLEAMRASIRREAAGKSVTAQCDGWSGQNHHHYIAFMATVDGKVRTVLVDDASDECKTVENLLQRMIEVVKILEKEWSVCVIAFTTDASGESRKARKLLARLYPHMITPDCYAHQINLIVGDYFKVNQGFLKYSTLATELITWLRSKTFLLALIQEVQKEKGLRVITVIQAVITRWTAHYLAYRRLLELQSTLKFLVAEDEMLSPKEKRVVTGDVKARQRANMMLGIINDPLFWHSLARIKVHLEPLAIAANITQSAFCHLDQVLLTFGSLYMHYTKELSATDSVEKLVRYALLSSIEKRWGKSDQEVFIAAVVLNPFMKLKPFQRTMRTSFLTIAGINDLLSRLYSRFFSDTLDPSELLSNIQDYMYNKGIFSLLPSWADTMAKQSLGQNTSPNPSLIYEGLGHGPGLPQPPLFRLALHIFSVCANSASCERLFSVLGNTLTKLRNRLGTKTLASLAEMKMHIRDEQLQQTAKVQERLKRNFGKAKDSTLPSEVPLVPNMSEAVEISDGWMDDGDDSVDHTTLDNGGRDSFQTMTEEMSRRADDDEDDLGIPGGFDDDEVPMVLGDGPISITIQDLFDFESTSWVSFHQRSATRSLEELEFYELCDFDADGEVEGGFDVDIDETIASIIHS